MAKFDLNHRSFVAKSNTDNGEVDSKTIFNYYQEKEVIWAKYSGPQIKKGFLLGKYVDESTIQFNYQHINSSMRLMTGKCLSKIEKLDSGKLRLLENWEWTCDDFSKGKSVIEEL